MATPLVEELVDYLETQSIGTVGTTLFANFQPENDATTTIATLRETATAPDMPGMRVSVTAIQVKVRAADYATARQHAAKIHNLFSGMVGVDVGNNYVRVSRAASSIAPLGPDGRGREEVTGNYEFVTHSEVASGEASTGIGGDKDPNLN